MSKPNIIYSNKNATNYSFLYFLHEEDRFDEKSFMTYMLMLVNWKV